MSSIAHLDYIIAAYAVAGLALAAMIGAVWWDHRSLNRQLEALERGRDGKSETSR